MRFVLVGRGDRRHGDGGRKDGERQVWEANERVYARKLRVCMLASLLPYTPSHTHSGIRTRSHTHTLAPEHIYTPSHAHSRMRTRSHTLAHALVCPRLDTRVCPRLRHGPLTLDAELASGHRVSRPRGTGSVGDSVGEGANTNDLTRSHTHAWAPGLMRLPCTMLHAPCTMQ